MRVFLFVLSIAVLLTLPLLTCIAHETNEKQPQTALRSLEIGDEYKIQSVGSPVLSSDGKWVTYTVTTSDFEKNSSTSRIWMIPTAGGKPVPMTAKSISSGQPKFSKDGSKLYFLSARYGGVSQIWFLDTVHGGEAQQLTDLSRGVDAINLSPDEKSLVLTLKDVDPSSSGDEKEENADPKQAQPWVVDRIQMKHDYVGYLDHLRNHLYIYHLDSKKLTQITSGDYDDSSPAWSPDGKTIAFVSNRTEEPDINQNSDIWLVDADNSDQGKNLTRITSNQGADSSPRWHPNGKSIACVSATDVTAGHFATNHLMVVDLADGNTNLLTEKIDRNVSGLKFSEDGSYIYFNLEDSGEVHIARMPVSGGNLTRPIAGQLSAQSYALGSDGTIVAIISKPDRLGELFVAAGKKELRQLTNINTELFSKIHLGETEEIHFKSHDGLEIEGFVTKPPSFNPAFRYPTLLRIHGGPVSQYNYGFSFEAQLLAANDYVVVRCNPRGSSGYGQEFCYGLWQGWGEKDYRDVLAAVDHVIEMGYADPNRLGVGGYSYGGILTNYLITQTDRFKAAVSGAGSALYLASYGHDEYQYWFESEFGLPWESRELWDRLSPFNYVQNVTTPTLFVCGEKDWNVPVQGCEQLYQALRRRGIPTLLVVYPGEHHGGWSFGHSKDYTERLLGWYDKYLKPEK